MTPIPPREAAAFLLCAVITAPPVFRVAFNLGAYGDVLYEHQMTLWAASIAALVAVLVIGRAADGQRMAPWWGVILLALPSLWMLDEVMFYGVQSTPVDIIRGVLTWSSVLLSLPYTLYFISMALTPDLNNLTSRRTRVAIVAIWVVIFSAGIIVGSHNDWFMTCRDFEIAGALAPDNCWKTN
ncbi:MAG: hypothetical protein ACPGGK_10295 [Pikeienuella sp.]